MLRGLASIPWTLDSGQTIQLPDEWPGMSPQEQIGWIGSSDLSIADASALEEELGLDVFGTSTPEEQQQVQSLALAGYDTTIKSARALEQAIANSQNGVFSVPKTSSAYVIATNNSGLFGSFSVVQDPMNPTNYLISKSSVLGLAAGGGIGVIAVAIVAAIALSRR